jgi:hypothetical protein
MLAFEYQTNEGIIDVMCKNAKTCEAMKKLIDSKDVIFKIHESGSDSGSDYIGSESDSESSWDDISEISEEDCISNVFVVKGSVKKSGRFSKYTVTQENSKWTCTCPHYLHRLSEKGGVPSDKGCKHILDAVSGVFIHKKIS